MKEYAVQNKVPILKDESLMFILDYIVHNEVRSILEIGTAIGYSSINMALLNKDIKITTIERDPKMYEEAIKNIKDNSLDNQIEVILADALTVDLNKKYDLIFIDAAKAQYIKFFEKFKYNLNEKGVIITDNLLFHGLVAKKDTIESKNLRSLVTKIDNYVKFLKDNQEFSTIFYEIGDGLSVTRRN